MNRPATSFKPPLRRAALGAALVCLSAGGLALAGGVHDLGWYTIDSGTHVTSTGGYFELLGSIGQPDAAVLVGGDFTLYGGFWAFSQVQHRAGDCDGDDFVTLDDYEPFAGCLLGPGVSPVPACFCFDLDRDNDVDLDDAVAFQRSYDAE